MKIKLFTHIDLDGAGSAVVAKHAFKDSVDITYCGYSTIEKRLTEFLNSPEFENTDIIFLTDISIKSEVVIKLINEKASTKLLIIDHHKTAEHLNKYDWARVNVFDNDDRLSSGTSAFYNFLKKNNLIKPTPELDEFVEHVRLYDSWDWTRTKPKNEHANLLNTLHILLGNWKFVERFYDNPCILFNEKERFVLDIEKKKVERLLKEKMNSVIFEEMSIKGTKYNFGIVFVSQYVSEIGNVIMEYYKELDFVALIIDCEYVSFRSTREDIDLSEIAKEFDGGGHKQASGAKLSDELKSKVVNSIFFKKGRF